MSGYAGTSHAALQADVSAAGQEATELALDDLARLAGNARQRILDSTADGWPGNVELSLIDAVLSIRARYGVSADTTPASGGAEADRHPLGRARAGR